MSSSQSLKLVSFVICPFVQRSLIALNYKNSPYEIEYIDLANKPDWFLSQVPTGKVPALFVNDDVLFESSAINEYLEEITPAPRLMPEIAVERAKIRGKIALADELIFAQYRMLNSDNSEGFSTNKTKIIETLKKLEPHVETKPFSAEALDLFDIAIAPFFYRLAYTPKVLAEIKENVSPSLAAWIDGLNALGAVKESVREDFEPAFFEYFETRNSACLLAEKAA